MDSFKNDEQSSSVSSYKKMTDDEMEDFDVGFYMDIEEWKNDEIVHEKCERYLREIRHFERLKDKADSEDEKIKYSLFIKRREDKIKQIGGETFLLKKEEKIPAQQEGEGKTENHAPQEREGNAEEADKDEAQEQIAKWEAVIPQLHTRKEKKAARITIEKWRGKTHVEAYRIVCGDTTSDRSAISYVTGIKTEAENIARNFSLEMPPWSTK